MSTVNDGCSRSWSPTVRSTWDQTWMAVADAVASRSRCTRAGVGAVVVTDTNRIVATGYNGPPATFRDKYREVLSHETCETFCHRATVGPTPATLASYHDCPSIHAEANALMFCDRNQREGGTIYVTGSICFTCAKLVANSGVKRVVARWDEQYREPDRSKAFLADCGLTVVVATWE